MRITFGVGTGFDRNGRAIGDVEAEQLEVLAIEYLARRFGGVFRVEGKGAWLDDSGKLIAERGVQFIVETDSDGSVSAKEAGRMLRKLFNQTSVVVSVSQSVTSFVVEEKNHATQP